MIQVFGQTGMLGSAVVRVLRARGLPFHPHQADLEVVHAGHIHAPIVINCAGLVKQRKVSDSQMVCINGVGPHRLAEACRNVGARLIHVSTDCVFDGDGPHAECDPLDASDIYARSKLAGEVTTAPHLTIRTSFVGFGLRGLIADLQGSKPVKASARLLWSGHTVDAIANLLCDLAARTDLTGLLHVPGEHQTRLDLCHALARRYDLPAPIVRDDSYCADRRLISHRWEDCDLPPLPPFAVQLETMVAL